MVGPGRQRRAARQRSARQGHSVSLSPEPAGWNQGDPRGRANRVCKAETMRRKVHQRPAQGDVVVLVLRDQSRHARGVRDGLCARRFAAFCWSTACGAVRRRNPHQHGGAQEVHRVRKGPEGKVALLAYVFSHRHSGGVESAAYEDSLRRFHEALASAAPSGFIKSTSFRIGGEFSDWYLVESSAALDVLNAAAVSGARAAVHDAAARMAAGGAGKLLSLAAGQPSMESGFEIRFAKPDGMADVDLYARLQTWTGAPGVSLWRRMMVLGPPPEFCLVAPSEVELPADMHPAMLAREP